MDKQDDLSYAAVITMTLPGEEKPINLTVTLSPSSPVKLGEGQVKALRDCTLAELQQFAEKMEADIWARHEQSSLAELLEDGETQLEVQLLDKEKANSDKAKNWMEFTVALPDKETTADTATETAEALSEAVSEEAESPALDESPAEETESEETAAETVAEAAVEAEDTTEKTADDNTDETAAAGDEPEPDVTVSESEPVHEEREGPIGDRGPIEDRLIETTPPPIKSGKIRILGKRRPLNHPTWTAVDILMNEPAFRDSQAHALSSLNREVAGFLIGPQPEKQPDGRYLVHISDVIIAKHTKMQGASVTYTPESWRYVTDRLAEMYPDETAVIVGWYHTHPGFGIFLSGMDQFIHRNFFIQSWHVALVLDPVAHRSGFFCWDRQQTKVDNYDFPWPSWAAGSW
jgi:proteasome lid subunit RPN8/RPN11